MKRLVLCFAVLTTMAGILARAQDVAGRWQGTLKADKDRRLILSVTKDGDRLLPKIDTFRHYGGGLQRLPAASPGGC